MDVTQPRKRVLLSAFACSSEWGSESGVGWQWLMQLVKVHDVHLLTHGYFRRHLEPALSNAGVAGLQIDYLDAPAFGMHPHRQLNSRAYYVWWQWHVRTLAKRLVAAGRFDLIHHLTWGSLRFPCFLGSLGVPLVMGPLGGGEAAPLRLFAGLPLKVRAFDYLRSLSLLWVRVDPLATWAPRRAVLVLCRSKDSLLALPTSVQKRAVVVPEIGSPPVDTSQRMPAADAAGAGGRRFRLLFAGRLLGWKGVALALGAVEKLVKAGWDVEFDIAGEGPLHAHLVSEVQRLGLARHVRILGVIPRERVMQLYSQADLFLFPSLHDSSGSVVLESLSRGLPVVCVDLGGPQNYIDSSCGVVVSTQGANRDALESRLADAVAALLADPVRLASMQANAAQHAQRQTWQATVKKSYDAIGGALGWAHASGDAS